MSTSSFREMSDADLDASLYDGEDPSAVDAADVTLDGEPGDPTPAAPPADPAATPATDPANPPAGDQGPGDYREAIRQEREERKRERDAREAAERELAKYRDAEKAKALADADAEEAEAVQAKYDELLENEGPEAARAFLQRYTAVKAEDAKAEASKSVGHEAAVGRIRTSEQMAREFGGKDADGTPLYDKALAKVQAVYGKEYVAQKCLAAVNPAKWVMDEAAKHKTPAEVEAEVDARAKALAKQMLAEAKAKHKTPANAGHPTIGQISSATQDPGSGRKDPRKMSDAELDASLRE